MSNPYEALAGGLPDPESLERERQVGSSQVLVGGLKPAPTAVPDWTTITRGLPATQDLLADPVRAARVADDVDNLSALETVFKGLPGMVSGGLGDAARRGAWNDRIALIGYRQSQGWASPDEIAEADRLGALASRIPRPQVGLLARGLRAATESAPMMIGSVLEAGHETSVGSAAGVVAGALGGTVAAPGPGTVAGAAGGLLAGAGLGAKFGMTVAVGRREAGLAYREYMQIPGVTHEQARLSSTIVGAANGLLEVLPLDLVLQVPGFKALLRGAGTRDLFRAALRSTTGRTAVARAAVRLAGGMTVNGLQEAAQELSTILGGEAIDQTPGTAIDWDRVADAGVEGGLAGGVMGAAGVGAGLSADLSEAARARQNAAFWTELGTVAAESKTIKNLPAEAQAHIEAIQARQGGAVASVSAPAEALTTLFQSNGITPEAVAERMPLVAKQMEEAASNPGLEVSIPTAEFAVNIAPLKGYDGLVQDLRVGDGLTLREAEKVEAEAKALATKDAAAAPKDVPATPEQRVQADVAAKLEAVGQDPAPAAIWAGFAKVMAAKAGTDAWAFYETLGLQVSHEDIAAIPVDDGTQTLAQPTASVQVAESDGGATLQYPGQPLRLKLEKAAGALKVSLLDLGIEETRANQRSVGGQGYSTALYIRALRLAKDQGLGFESDVIRTDATERMYARLQKLGVPFRKQEKSEILDNLVISAAELKALDLDRVERVNEAEAEIQRLRGEKPTVLAQKIAVTETPEFKAWFGESKVVDQEGNPRVVYHATTAKPFSVFDAAFLGSNTEGNASDEALVGLARAGFWFSERADIAKEHYRRARTVKAYLAIANPMRWEGGLQALAEEIRDSGGAEAFVERARGEGFDGIVLHDDEFNATSWVAFEPTQIKSATGNSGAFDPSDPNILAQPTAKGDARGYVTFPKGRDWFRVTLTGSANLSTFLHESGHVFLEVMRSGAVKDAGLRADLDTIHAWLGAAPDGALTEEQLEKFARGFEAYLRDGKAPSSALAEVFQSFRAWLTFVYRTLQGLDVELTDEVRDVMDRLIATEAEIAQAKQDAGLVPAFDSAEAGGMTEAEFKAYQERWASGTRAATANVEQRSLEALHRTMGQERAATRVEVEDLAKAHPVFNLREFLRTGARLDGAEVDEAIAGAKLDRAALDGLTDARGLRRLNSMAVLEGGMDPDELAPYFGFESGAAMVQALVGTPRRDAWVKSEVAARMAEKYPDSQIAALAKLTRREVQQAEGFVRAMRDELDAAGRKIAAGPPRVVVEALRLAAKEHAAGMVELEMRPDTYRRAEATASTDFAKAMASKKYAEAYDAKRRQIWNHFMAAATTKARDEVERIREYGSSFDDVGVRRRIGKVDPDYLAAIDAIREGVQFKRESVRAIGQRYSLAKFIADRDAAGDVVAPQLREMADLKSYRQMTLLELRGVEAALANIDAMSKLKGKLLLSKGKRDMARTATELAASIRANLGTGARPTPGDLSFGDRFKELVRSTDADMKKVEFIARILDGGKTAGLAHELIFQPMRDAQNARYQMQEQVHGALMKPFQDLPAARRARYAKRVAFLPSAKSGKMVHLSMRNVLTVVLNLGNDGNRERLLQGYGWTHAEVLARLDQLLDDGDLALVSHIWQTVDSLWPAIRDLSERTVGLPPGRVEASAVTLPSGRKVSGGYYPIVKSRRLSYLGQQLAEKESTVWETNFFGPVVEHGFTEARGKDMSPLELSLDVVPAHLDKVIHYLTHYEAVRGVDKLLQRPEVRDAITQGLGAEYYNTLRPWLENIVADGSVHEPLVFYERLFRHLRYGSSVVLLFGKIPTGVKQALGLFTSGKEVRRRHMVTGVRTFLREGWAEVARESPEFKFIDKQLDRDAREMLTALESSFTELGGLRRKIAQYGMAPIMLVQKAVNAITWYGAREQALEEGHKNPAAYADAVVSMTQTGGGAKDLAQVQRGSELRKLFTVMFSYRSVLYNQMTEPVPAGQSKARAALTKATHFWWLVFLPVVVQELLMNGVGEDEDADDVAKRLALEMALLPASTIPFYGDGFQAAVRGRAPSGAPWLDTVYRSAVTAGKLATLDDLGKSDAKAVSDLVGSTLQLPTAALWNYGAYLDQLLAGELEEPVQDLLFRNPSKWE